MLHKTIQLLPACLLAAGLLAAGLMMPGVPAVLAKTQPTPALTPAATPVATAESVKSSPEQPLAYGDGWVDLQPGAWQWYAFKYSFDGSSDSNQAPASLRLDTKPGEGATLTLLNGEQVRAWEHGEKLEGFGAATPVTNAVRMKVELDTFCDDNPNDPVCTGGADRARSQCENLRNPASLDDTCNFTMKESRGYATWSGVIGASGTYYILVRGNPRVSGPIQYKLTIGGDGLSMK